MSTLVPSKAFLIDPIAATISEITWDGDYKSISTLLNCDLFTTVIIDEKQNTLFVDDEGLLTYPNPNGYFRYGCGDYIYAGRGLILGCDAEGYSVSPTDLTLPQVRLSVAFVHDPVPDEVEPKTGVYSFNSFQDMFDFLSGTTR